MEALANQMKHQYGQSATAFADHPVESTSATELELAKRIDVPVAGAQPGSRGRTSANRIVGTFRQTIDTYTELDESIELLLSQSLLATSTMSLPDLRAAFDISCTQKDYVSQSSLLVPLRKKLYVAEIDDEFVVYRHLAPTPIRSTTSRIAIRQGDTRWYMTTEEAKELLSSSEVDREDEFFSLAGSVRIEVANQSGDSHDETIYGDGSE